ncbi:NLR family CARD domain-containing protein 3 isoform X1 [Alosa sapidissima]|uniref:NLR family CARD domain-containing protein 3 isoform X1 n=2 Tax=Alosa sapidissima TaxID=34773 RepID=UPI001C09541E|nr:NLR family CARD domain-containing protein 3 isoform X1 [Alosa sapidissima]
MDKRSHIPWEEDCYIDLQSTNHKTGPQKEKEVSWLQKHQPALECLVYSSVLEGVVSHMKKAGLLTHSEAGLVQKAASLPDRWHTLVELLSIKDPQGSKLQSFLVTSYPMEYQLISQYDTVVQQQRTVLLQRFREEAETPSHKSVNQSHQAEDSSSPPALLLIEGVSDLQQREHDFTQLSVTRGAGPLYGRPLGLDKLLLPLTRTSPAPRVCLTVGLAGSGKSRLVSHFARLWGLGQIHQEISLVLPVACWELGSCERLSADRLMRMLLPQGSECVTVTSAYKTLLVIDGLEELRSPLDFAEAPATCDPKREVPVADLITNIVRGNLLPGAMLWLLCRPGVGARVPAGLVDRVTEVPPLTPMEIRQLLRTHRLTHARAEEIIWAHLDAQTPLMVLCTAPTTCGLIMDTLLRALDAGLEDRQLPQSLTEVYVHYCWPLREESEWMRNSVRKQLATLGKLAFYSLLRGRHAHTESEARAYGLELPPPPGSLGCRVLRREAGVCGSGAMCVWRFTHLSLQEFLAAVFYYLSARRGMFDLFSESSVSWPRIGFLSHYRAALQRADQSHAAAQKSSQSHATANLQLFLRFLTGLLSPATADTVSGALGLGRDEHAAHRVAVATALQAAVTGLGGGTVSMRCVSLVACLAEMRQGELLRSVEEDLIGCGLRGRLTASACAVLAYLLQVSPACADDTNLSMCLDHGALKRLLPQLLYISKLRLESNEFKDDAMELLGSLLSAKDCHIQSLSLADNLVTSKGAKPLSRALLVNRTLTTLDLRGNTIGPKGAKSLAEALKMNQALVTLNLQNNHIEDEGARALAELLQTNRKLSCLNLQKNNLSADGVRRIAESLKKNQTLQELNMSGNQLGDVGAVALAQALTVNHTLSSLRLQSSSVSDRGVAALTQALCSNHGLITLILRENSVGVDGAKAIAKALQKNHTLQELDLTANLLHDDGVTAIGKAVKVNRALTSLHLQWNFMKVNAAQALAQSLLSNTHLQLLDLQENALGDDGVISLATALKTNSSLSVLYLQGVSMGKAGAVALAEALMINQTLHTLDLRGNSIGMVGAKALSSALKTNRGLRRLNLQENALGMDGAIFIATALKGNHQLTYINLQGNGIGESGAKVVSEHIRAEAPECVVDI